MSQGNRYSVDSAEKGRVVKLGLDKPSLEEIEGVFGWGREGSVWANPCEYEHLSDFHPFKPDERTERAGFLAWNAAATRNLPPKKVILGEGEQKKEYYSICGYRDLMPHQHNFSNSSHMIKHLEECLIDDLTFHIFGAAKRSVMNPYGMLPKRLKHHITGYAIRFADLPVTPKDNLINPNTGQASSLPTNRVARSRIYGSVLIPTEIIDGAPLAAPSEIILDPKRSPDPIHQVMKPPPELPEFSENEQKKIDELVMPHGQFGLSPEKTRLEQLKLYQIGELELDPDLPITNPQKSLSAKLLKWRSDLPVDDILESLESGQISEPVFKKGGVDGVKENTWFVSYLTGIDHAIHPDPEFLFYDPEHDQTVISGVRRLYMETQVQPEIRAFNEEIEEDEIVQPRAVIPKEPPTRDLFSLADSVGYFKTDTIPKAVYPGARNVKTWIVTIAVSDKKIREAEESNFGEDSNQHYPPQDKFDWIPKTGLPPWRTVITKEEPSFMIPIPSGTGDPALDAVLSRTRPKEKKSLENSVDIVWYVHESEWEYKALEFDTERQHRARQEAVAHLYSKLPDPRIPDWRVYSWEFAPMPFTDRAAILVGVRQDWIDMNPFADNASVASVPPIATMPVLKNAPAPMLNWRKTFAPFPFWYDSNRGKYYGIKEADDHRQFYDQDEKKVKLDEAMEVLSDQLYQEIAIHNGKDPTPSPKISSSQYFQYFMNRSEPFIEREIHIEPRPNSAPRVIVSIDERLMDALPPAEKTVPTQDLPSINENFIQNEKYLVLKIPSANASGFLSFSERLEVAAGSMKKQAGAMGGKKAPGGLTSADLRRGANKVLRFLDDFGRLILGPNGINVDQGNAAVINNTRDETGAEYYMYLDPVDYRVIDIYAFNKTKMVAGVADFKNLWSPPNNIAMQFVFWAGATYIKTSSGRKDDGFDLGNLMNILTDPFGALGDLALGIPNIPGLPDGFLGQLLSNEIDAIKKGAANPPEPGAVNPADAAEQKMIQAAMKKQIADLVEKSGGKKNIYNMNTDVSNPSALHEDPMDLFEGLSAAGCGQDLFDNILSKVNLFNLLMLYLKCLGIELPIDLRCLWNFPWPLFDINLRLPWIFIPPMTLAGLWEIIRKIIFELLCQLIIQLLMMMVKEILEAILRAGGCLNDESDNKPPMTDAPFDFGPFDPEDMIDEALADVLDPLGGDQSPTDFANAIFNTCQPGLVSKGRGSSYGTNRSALTYLVGLKDILTGLEWCALMKGEATNDVLDRVISFTKVEYPGLYVKQEEAPKKRASQMPPGGYIGWPQRAGARTAYRNFFMCIASFLRSQLDERCSPSALRDKYGRPNLQDKTLDDKCDFNVDAVSPAQTNLDDFIKAEYRKKGLNEDEIAGLIKSAEDEAINKMLALDNIQATINEFLEVVVPQVTAPVLDTIIMQSFDSMFRGVGISFRGATEMITRDMESPDDDLQMMVNLVVNGRDYGIRDKWWTWRKIHYKRWWEWSYQQKYAFRWYADEEREYWVPADPIFLHDKFKVRTQTWPDPDLPDWLQDTIQYMTPPWPHAREYKQLFHPYIQRKYKEISHTGHSSLGEDHPDYARHKIGKEKTSFANFRTPHFYRNQRNLRFIQDYVLYNGTLGGVIPSIEHGKIKNDNLSSLLTVSNDKISFTVHLDKHGDNFEFNVFRDATTIKEYVNEVPDPPTDPDDEDHDSAYSYNKAEMVETPVPQINLLGGSNGVGGPIKVDLSQTVTTVDQAGEEIETKKYPWWHTRKVTQSDGWIQKDEFMKRFIGDDHPLAKALPLPIGEANIDLQNPENTGGIYDKIFQDLHDNWYVKEIEESLIDTIRKTPMESFWLEEYYSAQDWEDFDKNKPVELMNRMRLFGFDDPYVKLADIRAKARELMKDDLG